MSSDEDIVVENKKIKSNSVLLKQKPNDSGKSDDQSNKEKSLGANNPSVVKPPAGFETLRYKDHQSTNVTKEDKSILSEASKSGQVSRF